MTGERRKENDENLFPDSGTNLPTKSSPHGVRKAFWEVFISVFGGVVNFHRSERIKNVDIQPLLNPASSTSPCERLSSLLLLLLQVWLLIRRELKMMPRERKEEHAGLADNIQ
jgi:hypothetical protein